MKKTLLAILLAAVALGAQAQQQKKSVVLHPSIPPVESVKDAPFAGWLELSAGGKTFYLTEDGRYMMLGKVVDLGIQPGALAASPSGSAAPAPAAATQGAGEFTSEQDARIDVRKLPLGQSIKYVNGNGKRTLYVFSDPDCPYCRKFEQEMGQLTDTTIYVFPYPLERLHPGATNHASLLWCEKDRAAAWHDVMVSGKLRDTSKPGACANPVAANVALGESLRIFGTPTMFTADGRRVIGYVPASTILQYMDKK